MILWLDKASSLVDFDSEGFLNFGGWFIILFLFEIKCLVKLVVLGTVQIYG